MSKDINQLTKKENLNRHLNLVAELFVRKMIFTEHPEWVDNNGECKKCNEYYDSLLDIVEIE